MKLNDEQLSAVAELDTFIREPRTGGPHFFRLTGPAGTGKTTTISTVIERHPKKKFVFTATTNKATRVLRDALRESTFESPTCTIYSLLGLRMEANGMIKQLAKPENPFNILQFDAVVIDEGSMVNRFLWDYLNGSQHIGCKFIVLDDPAQIPPVGEKVSPTSAIQRQAILSRIMRHDNTIQRFCNELRSAALQPFPQLRIGTNLPSGDGVEFVGPKWFPKLLADCAEEFRGPVKAIAWRNSTVDLYNKLIRDKLFGAEWSNTPWLPEDRLVFLGPCESVHYDKPVSTDDEGVVVSVEQQEHPRYNLPCDVLHVRLDTNEMFDAWLVRNEGLAEYHRMKNVYLQNAKVTRGAWRHYWNFVDAFAKVRYSYALTAHRAQGSTYRKCFVDWRDILLNHERSEAYRVLYTACSRPREMLYLS